MIKDNIIKDAIEIINIYIGDEIVSKKIVNGIKKFMSNKCSDHPGITSHSEAIFKAKLRDLEFNLQSQNPTIIRLIDDMINDKFPAENLAFLEAYELNVDNWKEIMDRIATTEHVIKNLPSVKWKPCLNCNKREYFWRQEQVRSSDEPMTSFYTCKNCNRTYKVNR